MKARIRRIAIMAGIKPGMQDKCRDLCARPVPGMLEAMKAACLHNSSIYLKKIADPDQFILFGYAEYGGGNYQEDMARLSLHPVYIQWRKDCDTCLAADSSNQPWIELEPLFFTMGAADIASASPRCARIGMITGLKGEMEMEYRALHASVWPGVLQGIKDNNLWNYSIYLGEIGGKLYLLSYQEYVGADKAADDTRSRDLKINQRWWKLTDVCQEPLPDAAALKRIWSGMDEIYHHD
ncbi:MAG TPA: L-rhamnose mutarotase [Verrucomicrobiae bacterium]